MNEEMNIVADSTAAARRRRSEAGILTRLAETGDREALRDICRRMHERSIFAFIRFSAAKFDRNFDRILGQSANSVLVAAECGGRVVGGMWASAGEYYAGEGSALTTVHVLAVDPDGIGPLRRARCFLRLVAAAKAWGRSRMAETVLVHVTTGRKLRSTDKLLRAAGARAIGGGYML